MNIRLVAISLSIACLTAACGGDPVSASAPVGIEMKVQSDATDTLVFEHKSINTESKNPWAKFVSDARETLGADPSRIELDAVSIALEPSSTNVFDLSDLFAGEVSLLFEMNTSDNLYPVASGSVSASDAGTALTDDHARVQRVRVVLTPDLPRHFHAQLQKRSRGVTPERPPFGNDMALVDSNPRESAKRIVSNIRDTVEA